MQEAMAFVRREFGPEAVILHTRETAASRIWPWSRQAAVVEVTAGRDVLVTSRSGGQAARHNAAPVRTETAAPVVADAGSIRHVATTSHTEMNQQIHSLQALLQQLTARLEPDRADIPSELFSTYTRLIDAEVPEATARLLTARLKREFPQTDWSNASQAPLLLSGLVERELRCTGAIQVTPGRRKVVALVGPTGVGKTTTIAKLAANFKLRAGLRVGLVTVDTYRIAAVEQLRTYAEIIDIPMKVVTGPRDLTRVLQEMSDLDLVLVDTAGRSPADELQLHELKHLLAEGPVDEVHLVLSLAASTRSLINTARQFSGVRTGSLILTKLDESPGLGQLLAALPDLPFPISYLTTGQNVPDDIEPAVAARLARLVLGLEKL